MRFARLAAPLLRGAAAQGIGSRAARNRAGAGLEFLDLRQYQPGDDLRHIDWRQTSRRGRAVVRRYRDEAASDWFICVDGSASMNRGGKWRAAVDLGSALAYALLHGGHRAALIIFSGRIHAWCPPGRGQRHYALIARQLLGHRPPQTGGASLPGLCRERLRRSGNLLLISDFLRPDSMADDLRQLAASVSSGSALQVLSKNEAGLGVRGPAMLCDAESGEQRQVSLTPGVQADAEAALAAHNDRVRQLCASLSWRLSVAFDDDDWEWVLLKHLGA